MRPHKLSSMPGLPAEGGWGGSNRTLGIKMEGFTDEDIAKAVDFCDNDRIKSSLPRCPPFVSWLPCAERTARADAVLLPQR